MATRRRDSAAREPGLEGRTWPQGSDEYEYLNIQIKWPSYIICICIPAISQYEYRAGSGGWGHLGPQQEVGQDEVARLQEELGRETQGHAQRQHQLQDEVRLGDTPAARCWGGEGRQRHLAMW